MDATQPKSNKHSILKMLMRLANWNINKGRKRKSTKGTKGAFGKQAQWWDEPKGDSND